MAIYEIPLRPSQAQSFSVTLGTTDYRMRVTYCDAPEGGWVLDIGDATGAPLICGIPLVTGINLLGQYRHLGIPGRFYVVTDGEPDAVPTFDTLGTLSKLYFETFA